MERHSDYPWEHGLVLDLVLHSAISLVAESEPSSEQWMAPCLVRSMVRSTVLHWVPWMECQLGIEWVHDLEIVTVPRMVPNSVICWDYRWVIVLELYSGFESGSPLVVDSEMSWVHW